jgi:hypothetical protein
MEDGPRKVSQCAEVRREVTAGLELSRDNPVLNAPAVRLASAGSRNQNLTSELTKHFLGDA